FLLPSTSVFAQQTYVTQFDLFAGYSYLNSPRIGLAEHGFETQAGVRAKKWLSFGFDYSISTGDLVLTSDLLVHPLQQSLNAQTAQLTAAGNLPPAYHLRLPAIPPTKTSPAGPQISFRHWKEVTIFVRPSCGIIKEKATPHPADPFATLVVAN